MYSISGTVMGLFLDGTCRRNDPLEQIVPWFVAVASSINALNRFVVGNDSRFFAHRVIIFHGKSIPFSARTIEHSSTRRGNDKL